MMNMKHECAPWRTIFFSRLFFCKQLFSFFPGFCFRTRRGSAPRDLSALWRLDTGGARGGERACRCVWVHVVGFWVPVVLLQTESH